eukprot:CAMPEP_0196663642 /NCGR_PEP_ID=MMETSP1086-20130531/53638_1 /TAXON_ID=77921 /ORGANISM="Cyanoptyche  gloeocystis , Strain SAG4.97" /LENGTH=211 /DNA_ID=CAMNT_0041999539 /DNA_START=44 /DNA_END=677 /DNA_ORIENTATION=-
MGRSCTCVTSREVHRRYASNRRRRPAKKGGLNVVFGEGHTWGCHVTSHDRKGRGHVVHDSSEAERQGHVTDQMRGLVPIQECSPRSPLAGAPHWSAVPSPGRVSQAEDLLEADDALEDEDDEDTEAARLGFLAGGLWDRVGGLAFGGPSGFMGAPLARERGDREREGGWRCRGGGGERDMRRRGGGGERGRRRGERLRRMGERRGPGRSPN